jgi:hypothetical protein
MMLMGYSSPSACHRVVSVVADGGDDVESEDAGDNADAHPDEYVPPYVSRTT